MSQQLENNNQIFENIQEIVQQHEKSDTNKKVIRIYADGVYDCFHFGHARQLEQAKKAFPNVYLLVGVSSQDDTVKYKGQTLMSEEERIEQVKNCKWVDEVVYPCPWVLTKEFLDSHNIDYVAHDAIPYVGQGQKDIYSLVKEMGKFYETKRSEGISTSDIIMKIIQDRQTYTYYLLKKGFSRQQLNISKFTEFYLKLKFFFIPFCQFCKKRFNKEKQQKQKQQ